MRYGEQVFEIDVPLDGIDWKSASVVEEIEQRFHKRHEELYTYSSPGQEVVFVNARVAAIGQVATHGEGVKAASAVPPVARRRQAFFGKWREVPLFALESLAPGQCFEGIAIIEAETTTIVVNEGDRVTVNALGWLDIELAPGGGEN
jgi:N-methylhydantoinase A